MIVPVQSMAQPDSDHYAFCCKLPEPSGFAVPTTSGPAPADEQYLPHKVHMVHICQQQQEHVHSLLGAVAGKAGQSVPGM